MDKDREFSTWEHNIGSSGQVLSVQPKPVAHGVEQPPDYHFRIRVFGAHGLHDAPPLFGRPGIHSAETTLSGFEFVRWPRPWLKLRALDEQRENWLNPPDLVERVPEVVPGYPDRILPKDEASAKELRKRTLTNLYNQRPAWLDEAVAAAYGWPADLTDDEILKRLLDLNLARAARQ